MYYFAGLRYIIDGAGYHRKLNPEWQLSKKSKQELGVCLTKLNVDQITVERKIKSATKMIVMTVPSWKLRKSNTAPGKDELKAELQRLLKTDKHKHHLDSDLIKLFKEESLRDTDGKDSRFHQVIFTVPYEPKSQPAEMLWAYGKNHVASSFCKSRGLKELRVQMREGFYGDGLRHGPVTAEMAQKLIANTTRYVDQWVNNDEVLGPLGKVGHFEDSGVQKFKKERAAAELAGQEPPEEVDLGMYDDSVFGAGDREDDDEEKQAALQVYCLCKKPYDAELDMICCDACDDWFHLECIAMQPDDPVLVQDLVWTCQACCQKAKKQAEKSKRKADTPQESAEPKRKR